jgi:HNH endonuclease
VRNVWVHHLVLEAFVGPAPEGKPICRHFPDRDRHNNRLDNLQWGTYLENEADKLFHGMRATGDRNGGRLHPERVPRGARHGRQTKPHRTARGERHCSRTKPERVPRGERQGLAVLTDAKVALMRYLNVCHDVKSPALGEWFSVHDANARKVLRGKSWSHVPMQSNVQP